MFQALMQFASRMLDRGDWPVGRVLEVGSQNINGTVRDALELSSTEWIGIDLEKGPCVDLVVFPNEIVPRFGVESFDTVVSFDALEHDVRPWVTVEAMRSVLKPGGHMMITTPTFGFPLHRYPIDCYRFGEDAYRLWMFEGFKILALEMSDDPSGHQCMMAFGQKPLS